MIKDPYSIVILLLLIQALVLGLEAQPRLRKIFFVIPHVFWIYFLPMLAATCGVMDMGHPVLGAINNYLLPASLFLVLLPVDFKKIARLGGTALVMMSAGSVGIVLGTILAFGIFRDVVGREFWSGFGALSGSWTGGSANMIAVKEALGTPDNIFLPMVVVDTIVPYVWMGILVFLVKWQKNFDRWNHSNVKIFDALKDRLSPQQKTTPVRAWRNGLLGGMEPPRYRFPAGSGESVNIEGPRTSVRGAPSGETLLTRSQLKFFPAVILVLLALAAAVAAQSLAGHLPQIKEMFSKLTWAIIIISLMGLTASLTPARSLERLGASKVGYFLLYFVLASIGARANLAHMASALPLIMAGFVILAVHALVIFLVARILRAPLFFVAVASQANVGGVASAPMVAEFYHPGLSAVGLLLAIFGNIIGTYVGILTAQLCRLIS